MEITKDSWEKIASGDQHAYAEVYRIYFKRFYNYGKKFTDNDSLLEDTIQETLIIIWDKRHTLSSIDFPGTYYYTAFRNSLLQKLKQQRKITSENAIEEEPEFGADQLIIFKEAEADVKQHLQNALNTLTARQREAIFLRFYEGLSYEEVASVLQITTKATYKIMARALLQLKEGMLFHLGMILWCLRITRPEIF